MMQILCSTDGTAPPRLTKTRPILSCHIKNQHLGSARSNMALWSWFTKLHYCLWQYNICTDTTHEHVCKLRWFHFFLFLRWYCSIALTVILDIFGCLLKLTSILSMKWQQCYVLRWLSTDKNTQMPCTEHDKHRKNKFSWFLHPGPVDLKKLQNERQNDKTKTDIRDWKSADIKSTVTANNLSYGFGCNDGNDDEYVEQLRISDLTITHNDWKQQNKHSHLRYLLHTSVCFLLWYLLNFKLCIVQMLITHVCDFTLTLYMYVNRLGRTSEDYCCTERSEIFHVTALTMRAHRDAALNRYMWGCVGKVTFPTKRQLAKFITFSHTHAFYRNLFSI